MSKFRPLHDRILVKPDPPAAKTTGLAAVPGQEEEPQTGVVIAAGPMALRRAAAAGERAGGVPIWEINPDAVRIGDRLQWAKYSGREVQHNGTKHLLIRLEEVDGVLEEEPCPAES